MKKGNCLVIDNTCPTAIDRKPFIQLAKDYCNNFFLNYFGMLKYLKNSLSSEMLSF